MTDWRDLLDEILRYHETDLTDREFEFCFRLRDAPGDLTEAEQRMLREIAEQVCVEDDDE